MKRLDLLGGACLAVLAVACTTALGAVGEVRQQASNPRQSPDTANLTRQQRASQTAPQARTQQATTPRPSSQSGGTRSASAGPMYSSPIVSYPGNWPAIARRQERYGALQRMEDRPTRETRQRFGQVVREIRFDAGTTLGDAIDRISRDGGLNVFVNWPALEPFGVTREREVTLPPLTNVTWRKVLELLLQQVNATLGGVTQLDWAIDSGVLTISTREELSSQLVLRVYDIGDLLIPRRSVPRGTGLQLSAGTGTTGTGTAGTSTGGATGGIGSFTGGSTGTVP